MNSSANYYKLGLFVITATFLLCAGVIVLGAGRYFEKTIVIETYMTESIEGIGPGSAVKYQGITLGEVKSVRIAAGKYQPNFFRDGNFGSSVLLELALKRSLLPSDLEEEEFITWLHSAADAGLRARTASSGLTGPGFVQLVYLDPQEFPPPEVAWTPPDLYLPSAPSVVQVVVKAAENILRKVEDIDIDGIAREVNELIKTADEKIADLDTKAISDNAVAFLEEIRSSNDRLQEILNNPNIDPSLDDLRATLENAKDASAHLDAILGDPRIEEILTSVEETGKELPPAIEDFRRTVRRIDRLFDSQQGAIDQIITELNQALEKVNAIIEDASENPSRMLFGDPPPKTNPGGNQ